MSVPKPEIDRPIVVYDAGCQLCSRSIRLVRAFDWLRRFDDLGSAEAAVLYPETTGEGMDGVRVRFPDGGITVGINAVRSIMLRTPAGFLCGLLLYVPGLHWIGERGYGWIARNRARPERSDSCSIGDT